MLKGMLAGVSKGFLGDALGPLSAALAKSNRAEAMLDGVDGKKMDFAGSAATVALEPAKRSGFTKVSDALGGLAGPGIQGVADTLGGVGDQVEGAADAGASQAQKPVTDGQAKMAQLAKPKKETDAKVAAKEAEQRKQSGGGGSVKDRFKAAGDAVKGIGGVLKGLFGKRKSKG